MSGNRPKRASREAPKSKVCPRCTKEKDIEEFAINRATPTGRAYICKRCAADAANARLRRKRATEGKTVRRRQKAEDVLAAGEKLCGGPCGEVKPLEEFRPHARRKDGRRVLCRVCEGAWNRERARKKADAKRQRDGKPTTKVCVVCKVEKHRDDFERIQGGDGRMAWCSGCEAIPIPDGTKRCTTCGIPKVAEAFYSTPRAPGGRSQECQDCGREYGREYVHSEHGKVVRGAWVADHVDEIAEYMKEYGVEHAPEILANKRRHRKANRTQLNARARESYHNNIEKRRAQKRAEAKRNKARTQRESRKRRALLAANGFEEFEFAEIIERDSGLCGLCLEPVDPSLEYPERRSKSEDHLWARTLGGPHTRQNVMLAHLECNQARWHRVFAMMIAAGLAVATARGTGLQLLIPKSDLMAYVPYTDT